VSLAEHIAKICQINPEERFGMFEAKLFIFADGMDITAT
jgi:hypothetical protein